MIKIEQIKISKLKPATYNPRQITTKQYNDLKKSIEKFAGWEKKENPLWTDHPEGAGKGAVG